MNVENVREIPFTPINKISTSLHWSYEIYICVLVLPGDLSHWILSNSARKEVETMGKN